MHSLSDVKFISFDVDGTLWDFDSVMRESLELVLGELQSVDPRTATSLSVQRMIDLRNLVHSEKRGKATDLNQIRLESFCRALREAGNHDVSLAYRLYMLYLSLQENGKRPFPDVQPSLQFLHRKYSLGVISNGNTTPANLGLEDLFSFAIFSQCHGGVEKPNPWLFNLALKQSHCLPEEFVHVGDSLEDDIGGAEAAGIRCFWINRNRISSDGRDNTAIEIASMQELVEFLC